MKRRVTLEQIAEKAGCSVTVVSKTLNNSKSSAVVSEGMRRRVAQIAREMGYVPNYYAQALKKGKLRTIGLVCRLGGDGHFETEYWTRLIQGVERAARSTQNDLLLVGAYGTSSEFECGIDYLRQRRVDALIVPMPMYRREIMCLEDPSEFPVVLVAADRTPGFPAIGVDITQAITQTVLHLRSLGHCSLLYVDTMRHGEPCDRSRLHALSRVAADNELRFETLSLSEDETSGCRSTDEFVAAFERQFAAYLAFGHIPTAIVAYNERIAMAIYNVLSRAGLRIPEDVSVVGFEAVFAHLMCPPMTAIRAGLSEMGERAMEVALELIDRTSPPDAQDVYVQISTDLCIRKSTARPRKPISDPAAGT